MQCFPCAGGDGRGAARLWAVLVAGRGLAVLLVALSVLSSALLVGVSAMPARAAVLSLDAPESTGDGKPFVVTVAADAPGDVVLDWRGQAVTVPVAPADAGSASPADPVRWIGQAILAVPLDTKPGTETLRARVAGQPKAAPAVTRAVAVVRAAYPEQRLTVEGKYVNPDKTALDRHEAERVRVKAALALRTPERLWALPMARPVPGDVSSLFGLRRVFNGEPRAPHRGLDLRGEAGELVKACAAGRVVLAENHYFAGNSVYIDHGMGVVSMYFHLLAMDVAPGQMVARDQVIGKVGSTGRVTGPHLHFGMAVLGDMVDPQVLLDNAPANTGASTRE
ncbi:M23 family metallopeptidase [Nitratidesulfovibrio sp. SRB-5]|uniref:M23 family metallopeptidase n=1 Tax=Nitratidesulfovibrio sp. SRB-5 TaxID=2872636 RepID=UPI001026671C|nr:M23 family metallopeptidase [Nitratidesulfovibrio sp. SRB-5]MBZ2171512.1 M23 family metallopeptidase [Nitratidesulfovibrio sp. SRB-5]RXF76234.1 M23 family metallopeptidase [Desulfovibrio sp. DS-1]